jgi:Cu2+-exporting ATPase
MKISDFNLNGHEDNTINDRMDSFYADTGNKHPGNTIQVENSYQCKIKCEGHKVYYKPGYCPDCNMKLVSLNKNQNLF